MTDDYNRAFAPLFAELQDLPHHAQLYVEDRLSMRRPREASSRVPALPERIVGQVRKPPALPLPRIEFIQCVVGLNEQAQRSGDWSGRLLGPLARAAADDINPLAGKLSRQPICLGSTFG